MIQIIFYNQAFNSRAAVFESFLRGAGNITEAPPVADEARRCWRKTRSIAPAPRAIGDYVLRGLERLAEQDARARTRSSSGAFACECAEQLTESRKLCPAAWRCRGYRGIPPVLLFFCRRFLFQIKRKCRNAGSIKYWIVAGREGRVQILQIYIVLLVRQRCVEVAAPYRLHATKIA